MTQPLAFALSRLSTPIGTLLAATDDQGRLRVLDWESHLGRMHALMRRFYGADGARLVEAAAAGPVIDTLSAYFAGDLSVLDAIPVESPGTPFQREVWRALREIPAGETWSYARLAAHVGRPRAARAVGAANGVNPIGVVVPCHRVIGADGSLTGYGGGLDRKQWLLRHESALRQAAA